MTSSKKGFVFSVDGLISLLILASLIVISHGLLANLDFGEVNRTELKNFGESTLTAFEKGKDLEIMVRLDSTYHIKSFFNRMPYSTCMDLRIYSSSDLNNTVSSVSREGCTNVAQNKITLYRSFISNNTYNPSIYLAELNVWRRA